MRIEPSDRIKKIGGYAFAEVDRLVGTLRASGIEPIDFGVGDPTIPTPEFIRRAGQEGIERRKASGYPSYDGSAEFREAVALWNRQRFGVSLDPEKEICSNIGSKEAVFNFPQGFVNPGDYALVPNPGYPPYLRGTEFAEGRVHFMNLVKENDFFPVLSDIPRGIVKKARIIWANYPNSPVGKIATREFYKELIDFGHDNGIIIASDEAYSEIYFGEKPMSLLEFSKEGVVVFNSLSKRSAMTGWRVGWVAGDENIINVFKKLKTNIDSGTATFVQDAAIAAYGDESHVAQMRQEYLRKMQILSAAFSDMGLENCMPQATIYLWQRAPAGMSSVDFAKKLLSPGLGIVSTPGEWISETAHGTNPGKDYVRLALVPPIEQVKLAAERIRKIRF